MSGSLGVSALQGVKLSLGGIGVWRAVLQGLIRGADENQKIVSQAASWFLSPLGPRQTPVRPGSWAVV